MAEFARVNAVEYVRARTLRVTFTDGLVRELDFAGKLPGVLALIDNDVTFPEAAVDSVAGTVSWPNGIDLDPDVLHGEPAASSAVQPRIEREYWLQQTA